MCNIINCLIRQDFFYKKKLLIKKNCTFSIFAQFFSVKLYHKWSLKLSDVSGAASYGSQGYRVAPHDAGFRRDEGLGHQVAPHSLMYEPVTLAREDQGAHFGGTVFTARPSKQGHLGAR